MPGYAPLEAAFVPQQLPALFLVAEKDARPGMVFVPAGRSTLAYAPPVDLPAYWLDRHELTNREFETFVRAGGYRRPELWRCAVYDAPPPEAAFGPLDRVLVDYSKKTPVGDDVFAVYRGYFDYDRRDLDARVEAKDDRPEHWRVEKVSFAAAYGGERVPAYLFLPSNAQPPYQTLVYFPPVSATQLSSREGLGSWDFGFLVRSGRAVLFPVYKGTYERRGRPAQGPNEVRELVIQRTKDVRRAVDYLESRADIDPGRLAFYGLRMGALCGPVVPRRARSTCSSTAATSRPSARSPERRSTGSTESSARSPPAGPERGLTASSAAVERAARERRGPVRPGAPAREL